MLPKPPPMCSVITVTFLRSTPRASASPSRTVKVPWVEAHTVSSSPSQRATTPCVSSVAWVWVARRYSASTLAAASAKPFCTSPRPPPRRGVMGPTTLPFFGTPSGPGICSSP